MADFNFTDKEKKILEFWKENQIFEKSLEIRKKAKRFVFFEGPPTANGRPGIHHFLGRAFKDLFCRYKTMQGYFVLRKAGWDTHGLPVEIEVEKELGFKNKKDIEQYGIDKFNKKAKESVWKYKNDWEEMTKRMGFWLDEKNSYITYEPKYIETLWDIIKKIWDKKLLYLAHRVVPFCTRCGTSLSSHEVALGYQKVKERSVYIKFKLKNQANTFILAWTTTPWTLPGNVALAVGKDIEYVVAEKDQENYIIAKDLAQKVLGDDHKIERQVSGKELIGLEYEPLFDIQGLRSDKSYKIYDADFVSTQDGTGVVHTAVMYGEDDYNLGTKLGLPKIHTVDEQGKFKVVGHGLDGMYVKDKQAEDLIVSTLDKSGNLLKTEDYEHDYPFCWRCSTPLLYYAKNSWFIKMSAVNKDILKNNQKINWVPEHIKEGRFGQWLKEGKDWAFSRERYWGTPLPVWKCNNCLEHRVAGSLEDLEKYRFRPKNEFYLLRHGHSTKNKGGDMEETISSMLENDKYHLTEEGKKQAHEAAKKIKKLGIDVVISSPFLRTKETAQIIAEEIGKNVHIDERIMEFQHGQMCEGKTKHSCEMGFGRNDWEVKSGEGESWKDLKKRMSLFLRDIDSKYEQKKILIVSHGEPVWLAEVFTLGLTGEEAINTREEKYPNTGDIKKVDLKNWPFDENGDLDLHRPYIDTISLKCDKCGSEMKKVPDLIDVWFDSGAMPYAQWHWPFENEKILKEQFPADFVTEAIDQTRGWFYTLLSISTLLGKGAPYKNVICYSHVLDEKGQKMSKSRGNVVSPFEVMDKFGADVPRWYFYTVNDPSDSKVYNEKDIEQKQKGFLGTLGNCLRFYELYNAGGSNVDINTQNLLDKWILSRLANITKDITEGLDKYSPSLSARVLEKFVAEDFSNWWLRRSRKRKDSLGLLRHILLEVSKLAAPFIPFTAEDMYMRLHKGMTSPVQSVHLCDWPSVNKKLIDTNLEQQMNEVRNLIAEGLALRKSKQIKVRQPLRSATFGLSNEFPADLEELVKEELNVKNIIYDKSQNDKISLDLILDQDLTHEGYARELIRQIQDMRKEAKYRLDEKVFGQWHSDDQEINIVLKDWERQIKEETLLSSLENYSEDNKAYNIEKEFDIVPGKKIWLGLWN